MKTNSMCVCVHLYYIFIYIYKANKNSNLLNIHKYFNQKISKF